MGSIGKSCCVLISSVIFIHWSSVISGVQSIWLCRAMLAARSTSTAESISCGSRESRGFDVQVSDILTSVDFGSKPEYSSCPLDCSALMYCCVFLALTLLYQSAEGNRILQETKWLQKKGLLCMSSTYK